MRSNERARANKVTILIFGIRRFGLGRVRFHSQRYCFGLKLHYNIICSIYFFEVTTVIVGLRSTRFRSIPFLI